jgi:hypothetical protein
VKKQAVEAFVNDEYRGDDEQRGFHESGKILKFTVPVRVAFVGGLVGHAHGEERNYRREQIETGMQRFGQNAKAAGANDQKGLEGQQHDGGAHAEQRGALLFADFLSLADGWHGSLDYLKFKR